VHGGSVLESVEGLVLLDVLGVLDVLDVLGELSVLGVLGELGLRNEPGLLSELVLPRFELFRPLEEPRPGDTREPRWRIGPLRPFEPLDPLGLLNAPGLPRPDRPLGEVELVDPVRGPGLGSAGVGSAGVSVEVRGVGAQLTPGVIGDDTPVGLVDLGGLVDVGEFADVVGLDPVGLGDVVELGCCANAGAVMLKAIAHARLAPLRMGIFRILINLSLLRGHSH
jgi:hypothetical protein